jgi:fibronectin type 3 domain-containing protein
VPKRDADLNIIYDAEGNTTTVTGPLSPENVAKQLAWIKDALDGFDHCEWLARHSLYNWVQDARSMVLDNKLTPAGKYFEAYKSKVGFSKAKEYIHTWKIAPPLPSYTLSTDCKTIDIKWYDHNGETGKYYVLERKYDNETEYSAVDTVYAGTDYAYGSTAVYTDSVTSHSASYRLKAMSYKDTESAYSRILFLALDAITAPANLQGTAASSSIIDLSWSKVNDARSYNLKRSSAVDRTYETIASYLTDAAYRDDALAVNTTYYYKVSAINNRGEMADSNPIAVTTKSIETPAIVSGLFPSAGDTQAVITRDFQYDALFRVYRSDSDEGTYVKVGDSIAGTRYADKGLVNRQTYYYKVTAFNTAGECAASTALDITPVASQHAYFNFDESEGDTAHDLWGGYHGTLYNGATRVSGQTGNAVSLTTGNQGYVHLGDGLTSELNDFTISFRINSTSKGSRIFDFGESTGVFMMFSPGLRYKIPCPAEIQQCIKVLHNSETVVYTENQTLAYAV